MATAHPSGVHGRGGDTSDYIHDGARTRGMTAAVAGGDEQRRRRWRASGGNAGGYASDNSSARWGGSSSRERTGRDKRTRVKNDIKSSKGTANGNSKSSPEDIEKLLDNVRPFAFTLLGLVTTIGWNVWVEGHKAAISHAFADFLAYSFAVMFVLSALTSASACVLPPRANGLNAICISVLLMILYNINLVFVLIYVWEVNHGRDIRARLIAVGSALNIVAAVSWIFIWGGHKELFAYTFRDALTVLSNKLWWFLRQMATYTFKIPGAMLSVFKRIILFDRVLVCFGLRDAASQVC